MTFSGLGGCSSAHLGPLGGDWSSIVGLPVFQPLIIVDVYRLPLPESCSTTTSPSESEAGYRPSLLQILLAQRIFDLRFGLHPKINVGYQGDASPEI